MGSSKDWRTIGMHLSTNSPIYAPRILTGTSPMPSRTPGPTFRYLLFLTTNFWPPISSRLTTRRSGAMRTWTLGEKMATFDQTNTRIKSPLRSRMTRIGTHRVTGPNCLYLHRSREAPGFGTLGRRMQIRPMPSEHHEDQPRRRGSAIWKSLSLAASVFLSRALSRAT